MLSIAMSLMNCALSSSWYPQKNERVGAAQIRQFLGLRSDTAKGGLLVPVHRRGALVFQLCSEKACDKGQPSNNLPVLLTIGGY